ncbi:MAG: hypothetical protein ACOCQ0_00135 [Desulfosalsimonas sp.]
MKAPDAAEIKNEIDEISNRIENILKTVKKHYPVSAAETTGETDSGAEAQQENSNCHLKQTPDQEA